MAELKPMYTVKEAAELLSLTEATIREWLRKGYVRGERIAGARWRIPHSEMQRLLRTKE